MYYAMIDTLLGTCGIAWSDEGLTRIQLPERNVSLTEARMHSGRLLRHEDDLPPLASEAAGLLQDYAKGVGVDFSTLLLDFRNVSDFERRVYRALRAVARGQTVTYGELAARAGVPGAAQAVGTAMAKNPWPVVVPCHRVLAAGNKPGGFSAPGGLTTKQKLLAMEGVYLDGGMPTFPGLFDNP